MKIGILTSGGDSPGMNAVTRAITRGGLYYGFEVYGVYGGYKGLVENNIKKFNRASVRDMLNKGGTFILSARYPEFHNIDTQKKAVEVLNEAGIDWLVVIGGDGSFRGALSLAKLGVKVICVPATIDNDLHYTDNSVGFSTSTATAVDAIDKLRDTSGSHQRCFIVEVMGRRCGDIAYHAAIASGAKYVITPETGFDKNALFKELKRQNDVGITHSFVVITEKIVDVNELAKEIQAVIGIDTRATVLGHIQRGGTPTPEDRILAVRFGEYVIQLIRTNKFAQAVGFKDGKMINIDIKEALNKNKRNSKDLQRVFKTTI